MPEFDIEKFLNMPIEAFDFQFMIGDVKDFLEFSESNIDWQCRRELQAIAHRKDFDDFPPGYRDHLEQNVDHRFRVSLPLRVRFGALLAFITSVEWAVVYLNRSLTNPVSEKTDGRTNLTVTLLRELSARASVNPQSVIDNAGSNSQLHRSQCRRSDHIPVQNRFAQRRRENRRHLARELAFLR